MSTSVAGLSTNFFPSAENGFTTTTSGSVSSGATTVGLNSVAGYSNGEVAVFVIDPTDANKKQAFTGVIDTSGSQVTSVQWTAGTNQSHALGATVVDYAAATHVSMTTKGILQEHKQSGAHSDITADSVVVAGNVEAESFTVTGAGGDQGWNTGLPVPDTIVDNGNRSYTWTFTGTDVTDTLSPGMRLRATRTVTAPTQCTDLESSSSQYWQDTTVSGHSFTDDFVAGAWVELESYPSTNYDIISRYNGTSGWILKITSSGQVLLQGNNGGAGNYSFVQSYQSIPLGKKVHIAAQLDMSAFTATSTTSYIMIDGVDVPCSVSRAGTNPTALIQAGNLQVGAGNSTEFFDGQIAQAFVTSAKITQANVRLIKNQGLTSALITTHSIVSAYDFNGNANDLNTTSANNLSAVASAGYVTDSPFSLGNELASGYTDGTTDFGIVTSATFSTDSTVTVQAPEGCTFPTSGGLSAVYYSSLDTPYGFPRDKNKWAVFTLCKIQTVQSSPSSGTWYYTGNISLSVPVGAWNYGYELQLYGSKGASVFDLYSTLSGGTASETDNELTSVITGYDTISAVQKREKPLVLSSVTPYYINIKTSSSGVGNIQIPSNTTFGASRVYAECAYV